MAQRAGRMTSRIRVTRMAMTGGKNNEIVGVVLTGGGSLRMGTPKCDLVVAGRPVVARLCELLAERTRAVVIVGRRPAEWNEGAVPVYGDEWPGQGPLGGIATGLMAAGARADAGGAATAACVVACDSMAMEGAVLDFLLAGRDERAAATVLVNPRTGLVEPMPGIYEAAAIGSIEAALKTGRLSVVEWLAGAKARQLAVPESLADQLLGANTPEELAAMERRLAGRRGR